jgi:hypothetical protein
MFILRKISGKGIEMNFSLGSSYTLVIEERNPNEFKEYLDNSYKRIGAIASDKLYGIISDENGRRIELFKNQKNFIMTSGGKTFDNISY